MAAAGVAWAIVVPVKRLAVAKSRLLVPPALRRDLALAMALDSVRAALACPLVSTVVAVNDDADATELLRALGAQVVRDEPDAGLNSALVHGAAEVARAGVAAGGIAALSADLPALRPTELAAVLDAAGGTASAVVADASGTGTTLLMAGADTPFRPAFGADSRAAHVAAGAVDLTDVAGPSLRRDVDTLADLRTARLLGCGPATTAVLAHHPDLAGEPAAG